MLHRVARIVRNLVEIYIPVVSFCIMFGAFIIEIFFRYVMNNPLTWPFELTTVGFLWSVLYGALYAMRSRSHISFGLLYDRMSPRWQRVMRIVSNGLIVVGFALAIVPSYRYVSFMHTQSTADFQIPMSIVYSPFLVFLVGIMIYAFTDLYRDLRDVLGERTKVEGGPHS